MKYLYAAILSLLILNATAQKKVGLAIKLGGGLAAQDVDNKDVISATSTSSYNFGGMAMIRFRDQWELQTGLEIATKGSFITEDALTTNQHAVFIDLPVSLARNFEVPGLGYYYLGAGGYAAVGVGGHNTFETPPSQTRNAVSYGADGDLQRYDAGLNFTTGLKLDNHLLFDVSYQIGLINLATTTLKSTGTNAVKNRLITVSLGYVFR